jgi:hypothetical protein
MLGSNGQKIIKVLCREPGPIALLILQSVKDTKLTVRNCRRCKNTRTVSAVTLPVLAMIALVLAPAAAAESMRSSPPDNTRYSRLPVAEDLAPPRPAGQPPAKTAFGVTMSVADAVVNNTNPKLKNTDFFNDGEVSIAVSARRPSEIVMTSFSNSWGRTAPLWRSTNGGRVWEKAFTINRPPGAAGAGGCPCDQTVDFTQFKGLAGTFLTSGPDNIYSALNRNPATATFLYFESPRGVAQATNHLDGRNNDDQPWLLIGPRPAAAGENVYVAYDDFNTEPDMHVAVAVATQPLVFDTDARTGFGTGFVNPGHRLAVDRRSGAIYSLFQRRIAAGAGGSQKIDYMLNRSTDGGKTWTLNGSGTGIVVAQADSTQPRPKFCTVNALLGGVDHAAVDPRTSDVVYVYGNRDPKTGNNRLALRRLTGNGAGGLKIGPEIFITGQVQAAIPSVAITDNGTIGVFYYTCDGISTSGYPVFTAHFAISGDQGASFTDLELERFLSPAAENTDSRQRVLGDYMQVKAVGNQFYGGFTGNGVPFGRRIANNDPIFYTVSVARPSAAMADDRH